MKTDLNLELMVLCDYASISQEGKVSINGIFDRIFNVKPPIILNGFIVATVSGASNTFYKVSLGIEAGNKNQTIAPPLNLNFTTGDNGKHNMVIQIHLELPHIGEYRIKMVSSEGRELGKRSFSVQKVKQQEEKAKIVN
ncbi:MAG: DUF6941 family protein [Candidatus Levyibacteriota bacterium]